MQISAKSAFPDNDSAQLNHRRNIGVVRNAAHDVVGVRAEAGLKRLDRITKQVTHADVGRRRARCAAGQALVDRVLLAMLAHAGFDQRHVLVAVINMVEAGTGGVGVHHTDFDHFLSPVGEVLERGASIVHQGRDSGK